MDINQARAFVHTIAGSELCKGADETESATYLISPVAKAFLDGALGWENVIGDLWCVGTYYRDKERVIGAFLKEVGEALLATTDAAVVKQATEESLELARIQRDAEEGNE